MPGEGTSFPFLIPLGLVWSCYYGLHAGGKLALPFSIWLGFTEGFLPSPYQMGMVKQLLIKTYEPDWSYVKHLSTDYEVKLYE